MERMRYFAIVLVVLVMASAPALAGTTRHDLDEDSVPVDLQVHVALGAAYDNVGRIIVTTPTADYFGSGTLIAPNWVLTAAHMVDDIMSGTVTFGATQYTAERWVAHSKWNGDLLNGNDIALIKLTTYVVGVDTAVRYTGSDEFGRVGTAVGYGMSGTGETGAVTPAGAKRAGENVIDAFYSRNPKKTPKIFLSDFDNPDNPADSAYGGGAPLDLEFLIAPGDSGGPVFIDVGDGPLLAGINSFGASFDGDTDSDYGDVSGHTRVSEFNKWIDDILGGGGGKGGGKGGGGNGKGGGKPSLFDSDLGIGSIPTPEPTTLILLAGGLPLLLKRRRLRLAALGRRRR